MVHCFTRLLHVVILGLFGLDPLPPVSLSLEEGRGGGVQDQARVLCGGGPVNIFRAVAGSGKVASGTEEASSAGGSAVLVLSWSFWSSSFTDFDFFPRHAVRITE